MEHTPRYFLTELNDGIQWLTDGHDFGIYPAAVPALLATLEGRAKQAHVASRGMAEVSEDAYPSRPHLGTFDECYAAGRVQARAAIKAAKGDQHD